MALTTLRDLGQNLLKRVDEMMNLGVQKVRLIRWIVDAGSLRDSTEAELLL